jgi:hypothetical protein
MTGPVVVDANVIVYSRDTRDAEKQRHAEAASPPLGPRRESAQRSSAARVLRHRHAQAAPRHAGGRGPSGRSGAAGVARRTARACRGGTPEEPRVFRCGETAEAEPALPGSSMAVDAVFKGNPRR